MPTLTLRNISRRRHHRDRDRRHAIFKRHDEIFKQYEIDFVDHLPSGAYISSVSWTSHGPTIANQATDLRATAAIAVDGATINDGETFVVRDSTGTAYTFEFDTDSSVVETSVLRQVALAGGETDEQIRALIVAAVNNSECRVTASDNASAASVVLRQDDSGADGNQTNSDTVTDASFSIVNFTGGTKSSGDAKAYADIGPGTGLVECTLTYSDGSIAQAAVRFRGSDAEDDSDDTTDYIR